MNDPNRNADLADLIAQIGDLKKQIEASENRELSDGEFCRRFLPISETTWLRLRNGTYGASTERVATRLAEAADDIVGRLDAIRRNAETDREFVRTTLAKAALATIARARDGMNRRIVAILAPTGYGKSEIGKYLQAHGAIYVMGRESWRSSYKSFCLDILKALGRHLPKKAGQAEAEERMLAALQARDGTLYLDEANTMSAACVNGVKTIVNATGYSVVLAATPSAWDRLASGAPDEVAQLINRCQPIIRMQEVIESDAAAFVRKSNLPESDRRAAAKLLADAGTKFGGLKTVVTAINGLAADAPTIECLRKAIAL